MGLSSFCYALNSVIFKMIAIDTGFRNSLFWGLLGQVILGIIIFALVTRYRNEFLRVIRENTKVVLGLNFLNGFIILIGDIAFSYATLLAPIALVLVIGGFQPLFVFIFGIVLTLFMPNFISESLRKRALVQKFIGIAVIVGGSILLS